VAYSHWGNKRTAYSSTIGTDGDSLGRGVAVSQPSAAARTSSAALSAATFAPFSVAPSVTPSSVALTPTPVPTPSVALASSVAATGD